MGGLCKTHLDLSQTNYSHQQTGISLRQAFKLFNIQPPVYYYQAKPKTEDQKIRNKLSELATMNHRLGFWMMHHYATKIQDGPL